MSKDVALAGSRCVKDGVNLDAVCGTAVCVPTAADGDHMLPTTRTESENEELRRQL